MRKYHLLRCSDIGRSWPSSALFPLKKTAAIQRIWDKGSSTNRHFLLRQSLRCGVCYNTTLSRFPRWYSKPFCTSRENVNEIEADELSAADERFDEKFASATRGRRKREAAKHSFNLGHINVSLVGKPNVGKSTLFNRLTGRKSAIVSPVAGTTRDRKEAAGRLGDIEFVLCDTGGFEDPTVAHLSPSELLAPQHGTALVSAMHFQIRQALRNSDLLMVVVDAKQGISQEDMYLLRWVLANRGKPRIQSDMYEKCIAEVKQATGVSHIWGKNGIVLVANKSEGKGDVFDWGGDDLAWSAFLQDCIGLGVGYPIPVSAEHNQGIGDLHNAMLPYALASGYEKRENEKKAEENLSLESVFDENMNKKSLLAQDQAIVISMIGKPNAGKSTLVNAVIGEERCIAGPVPGLTRDAIQIEWEYGGRKMRLVDTAGIRRRTRLYGGISSAMSAFEGLARSDPRKSVATKEDKKNDSVLEDVSIGNSLRAIDSSHVVVVVVDAMAQQTDPDASGPLTRHDISLMGRVLDEGRCLIVVANKCDLSAADWQDMYKENIVDYVRHHVQSCIPMAAGVPVIATSALNSSGVEELLPQVCLMYDKWRSRIPTPKLNEWLHDAQAKQPPPAKGGAVYRGNRIVSGPLRIKYMTQPSSRPPTFVLFVNRFRPSSDILPESYQRYLINSIRERFRLDGIPLRFSIRGNSEGEKRKRMRSRGKIPEFFRRRVSSIESNRQVQRKKANASALRKEK